MSGVAANYVSTRLRGEHVRERLYSLTTATSWKDERTGKQRSHPASFQIIDVPLMEPCSERTSVQDDAVRSDHRSGKSGREG